MHLIYFLRTERASCYKVAKRECASRCGETVLPPRRCLPGEPFLPRLFFFPLTDVFAYTPLKMLDPERTAQKKAADALWSKYIRLRDRDTCQRCRRPGNQPHHIFSRRHLGTRYDPENGVTLCFYCHHVIAHSDYETIREFHVKRMGLEAYQNLRLRAYALTKPDFQMAILALKIFIHEEEVSKAVGR